MIQQQGARFKIIQSANAPPPGHGQLREDIAFTVGFQGEIKAGNLQHVHGNQSHLATATDPATATSGLWKGWIEQRYADAPGHENMVRKINPNAAPTWITREQEAADYAKNNPRARVDTVARAAGWLTVKPNDHFLSQQQYHPLLWHQVVGATALAIPIVTAPLWAPPVAAAAVEATPTAVRLADTANKVRIAAEEVGGPQVRVAEEDLLHEAED
jgi:hypothetical protein